METGEGVLGFANLPYARENKMGEKKTTPYAQSLTAFMVVVAAVCCLLCACQTAEATLTATVTPSPSETRVSRTPTPTRIPYRTRALTLTSTITRTTTPHPVSSATRNITWTPWPTRTPTLLPPDQTATQESIMDFLITKNGGCEFPCWWSIQPDKTTWNEVEKFISGYPDNLSIPYQPGSTHDKRITAFFGDYENRISVDFSLTKENVVKTMTVYPLMINLDITSALEKYGKPDQVWLYVMNAPEAHSLASFSILLFYPYRGIIIWYISPGNLESTKWYRSCLEEFTTGLILWSPSKYRSFEEVISENPYGTVDYSLPSITDSIPLEQATGMSVDEFYQNFTGKILRDCLVTPRELWDPQTTSLLMSGP
jgi:hypothetical protein